MGKLKLIKGLQLHVCVQYMNLSHAVIAVPVWRIGELKEAIAVVAG